METNSTIRWKRVAAAGLVGAILPIVILMIVITIYGMINRVSDETALGRYGVAAGRWVGPIGGFTVTLVMSGWAGRANPGAAVKQGLIIGAVVVALDCLFGVAVTQGAAIDLFEAMSLGGRIIAGALGGLLARRGAVGA